jgi:hypothetical protein
VDESRLRDALASVPLSRFQEAGLMDALVELAALGEAGPTAANGGNGVHEAQEERAIAELDVDDLVELAFGGE